MSKMNDLKTIMIILILVSEKNNEMSLNYMSKKYNKIYNPKLKYSNIKIPFFNCLRIIYNS